MKDKAIAKLKEEMEKDKNPYIQVVGGFLINHLEIHPESSEKILNIEKTIMKSLNEMKKAAEKNKVGNCAVLTDQEGFEIVLKYFDIDGTGVETTAATTVPVQTRNIEAPKAVEVEKKDSIDFDVNLDELLK